MERLRESRNCIRKVTSWAPIARFVIAILLVAAARPSRAQTYSEIYTFAPSNGQFLTSTLLTDRGGKFYGTTEDGQFGTCGWVGEVFQLKPMGSDWVLNPLHCFTAPLGGNDGALPIDYGGLAFGPDGNLYGTTNEGGVNGGTDSLGTVFKLNPPATFCAAALCPWTVTILHKFTDSPDGAFPNGNVAFDSAGNLYGTTGFGGQYGAGTVFKVSPSNGGWTESVLYAFFDGAEAQAGVVLDASGNLYGTLPVGGLGYGYIFELTPSESGWTKHVLYRFTDGADGQQPKAGLVFDPAGNLYGATFLGGANNGGVIYELSPLGDGWNFQVLYSLPGQGGVMSSLTMDAAGNLYGTTYSDGRHQLGDIFELSPGQGSWTYTDLHSYALGDDARNPIAGVTIAPDGTLYGTASDVLWKITQ